MRAERVFCPRSGLLPVPDVSERPIGRYSKEESWPRDHFYVVCKSGLLTKGGVKIGLLFTLLCLVLFSSGFAGWQIEFRKRSEGLARVKSTCSLHHFTSVRWMMLGTPNIGAYRRKAEPWQTNEALDDACLLSKTGSAMSRRLWCEEITVLLFKLFPLLSGACFVLKSYAFRFAIEPWHFSFVFEEGANEMKCYFL